MGKYEIVIIGAGPAGLRCAEILASSGKTVIVLEKNKVIGPKVCGGGITYKGLKELGIPNSLFQRKFKKVDVHTKLQDSKVETGEIFIATISRTDLGQWMAKKAKKAGAIIKSNSEVEKINEEFVTLKDKEEIHYDYLVGADGATSIVRKYLGLKMDNFLQAFQYIIPKKCQKMELFSDIEKFGNAYLWIFPYKNSVSVGTGWDSSKKIKQPALNISHKEIRKNFDEFCKKRFNLKKAKFEAFMINYDYKGHEFKNKFLVGDAGGFASGLTGEGMYFAIKSGEDVARKILNKNYKYQYIPHMLEAKKIQENLLRSTEINPTISKVEAEIMNLILKVKTFDKSIFNYLD